MIFPENQSPLFRVMLLEHRQAGRLPAARERFVERCDLTVGEREVAGASIVGGMLRAGGFWNRQHRGCTREKRERYLARSSLVRIGNGLQHLAWFTARRGEIIVPERRVGNDRDAMSLAPWKHRVLDCAFLQMIEHLIAANGALPRDILQFVEVVDV